MSKYVVAIMSAAEIAALHHIITDELENGVLDVENQALLSNAQAKLDEALRTAGESLSPAVPASKPVEPHTPESFRAFSRVPAPRYGTVRIWPPWYYTSRRYLWFYQLIIIHHIFHVH